MDNDSQDTITINANDYDYELPALDKLEFGTIDLTGIGAIGATISANNMYSINSATPYGNVTISTAGGSSGAFLSNGINGPMWSHNTGAGLKVSSDAEFEGDIKWKGRSLGKMLADIEKRLAILVPDPAKLEHFESLKKAYEHYKTLEALCELPTKEEE